MIHKQIDFDEWAKSRELTPTQTNGILALAKDVARLSARANAAALVAEQADAEFCSLAEKLNVDIEWFGCIPVSFVTDDGNEVDLP